MTNVPYVHTADGNITKGAPTLTLSVDKTPCLVRSVFSN